MHHVLLLHGAIGAREQLQPLADLLSKKYIIHTINFNGHGGTGSKNGFSIEGFAKDVLDYLQQNNIERVAVFGYSMGGYVGMWLARHHPHIITRIVTLATKFHWDEMIAAREIKMLDAATIEEKLPVFAQQLQLRHGSAHWRILLEKTKILLQQLGSNNALQLRDYKHILIPCLVLLGDKDKMVTREETIAVQEALPDGIYKLLPDTTHPIEQTNMKLLARSIEEFIQ